MPSNDPDHDIHDTLIRFLLPTAGVRGVHVRLQRTWQDITARAHYPARAASLLGQACTAAALFTGHTKVDGRLSIQLRGDHGLRTLFAECTAAGTLRGVLHLDPDSDAPADLQQLGGQAVLAITIENPGLDPREPQRYQSLVALTATELSTAFEEYFRQSEQLPTRLLLAADSSRAAGLLLQKLPGDRGDSDGWPRCGALFDTLRTPELLQTAGTDLLQRLFHEEQPQALGDKPLRFACSCSRERVTAMLQSLGEEEARAAADAAGGVVEVRCEFCGREYRFTPEEFPSLYGTGPVQSAAPERLQ